jgi:hypothetical protein
MSDDLATVDQTVLAADARLNDSLQRVSFAPGILLGAEAMQAEQAYHVRRMTRHQRWLVGPGTVFGLRVELQQPPNTPDDVRLIVHPGYAIDGLGREVIVDQSYAISLRDWLAAENAAGGTLAPFVGGVLYLRVTVRGRAVPQSLQPTVSSLFDAGLDPVVSARTDDGFLLEIATDAKQTGDTPARPLDAWAPEHATPAAADVPGPITPREQTTLNAVGDAAAKSALQLNAWLLGRALPPFDDSPGSAAGYEESARLLLASVHVTLATTATPPTTANTAVNNLVRPFVRPNVLLAALALP